MKEALSVLINIAKQKMKHSCDLTHSIEHVENVVKYTKFIAQDLNLSNTQKRALVLAAWWHDVSRTIPNKTSFVVMPFLDDTLSALMLWAYTIKYGLFGSVAGMSIKIILCKSLGTGAFLSRILFKKENRFLIDILKDADFLDILDVERMKKVLSLVPDSKLYYFGYKTISWWWISREKLKMKTQAAKKYLEKIIKEFLEWVTSFEVKQFFIETFGKKWSEKNLQKIYNLLDNLILTNCLSK